MVVVIAAAAVAGRVLDRPFAFFSRDPAASMNAPFYVGALSNIGVLVLWTGAVGALLCGVLVRWADTQKANALLTAGAFFAWLTLDDLFQVHEVVIPGLLHVPQVVVYGVYGLAAVGYAWRYQRFLRTTPWGLLVAAGILFTASLVVDLVSAETATNHHLLEDGAKLLGFVSASVWSIWSSVRSVRAGLLHPS